MSTLRVDNIKSRTGTTVTIPESHTLSVTGIASVSGNMNVAGSLNVSGGGTLNTTGVVTAGSIVVGSAVTINASGIVGGAATFTNLTVNGTQTVINTTNLEISDPLIGIGSGNTTDAQANGDGIQIYGATNKTLTYNDTKKAFETNIPWAPNETRIIAGAEKVHRQSGNTVTLTYNSSSSSNVGYTTNPTGDITLNVVGIPTSSDFDDHSISFAVIVNNTGTARTCTAVNLNGLSRTIRWAGGSLASAISGVTTTTGHSIFSFTGINTVGSASTAANYTVFGVVSGGFF